MIFFFALNIYLSKVKDDVIKLFIQTNPVKISCWSVFFGLYQIKLNDLKKKIALIYAFTYMFACTNRRLYGTAIFKKKKIHKNDQELFYSIFWL